MYFFVKNKKIINIIAAVVLTLVLVPALASANQGAAGNNGGVDRVDVLGIDGIDDTIALGGKDQDLPTTISNIINVALSLLGIVAVVIVLAGGFKWMTAGGSEDKTAEARKLIFAGVIGLAIVMSAWAIARFVLVQIATETGLQGAEEYTL
ncbi:MAG: hypothetical protein HOG08_02295 [Candidatus Magasanikbacteria bacterium]|jgi:hypothetical protein|nr:hypothetical protein [Candidatus Magasanikbacteria bacterium]